MAGEGGSGARFAFQSHPTTVELYQSLHQREAQSGRSPIMPAEAIKYVSLHMVWNAAPGVGNLKTDLT
jgi:hypothetical protein